MNPFPPKNIFDVVFLGIFLVVVIAVVRFVVRSIRSMYILHRFFKRSVEWHKEPVIERGNKYLFKDDKGLWQICTAADSKITENIVLVREALVLDNLYMAENKEVVARRVETMHPYEDAAARVLIGGKP